MPRGSINENLAAYFPESCLVEEDSGGTVDETGDLIENWTTVDTYDCAVSSDEGGEEFVSRKETIKHSHIIAINGSYDIDNRMRVTVTTGGYAGVYEIVNVIKDQWDLFTMLEVYKAE